MLLQVKIRVVRVYNKIPFYLFLSLKGLKYTSNTCNRYLDTNRLYKSKFKFTSKPLTTN